MERRRWVAARQSLQPFLQRHARRGTFVRHVLRLRAVGLGPMGRELALRGIWLAVRSVRLRLDQLIFRASHAAVSRTVVTAPIVTSRLRPRDGTRYGGGIS